MESYLPPRPMTELDEWEMWYHDEIEWLREGGRWGDSYEEWTVEEHMEEFAARICFRLMGLPRFYLPS